MKKVFNVFLILGLLSTLFFSCDVGLGESVDVIAPTVSIAYPPASVVIRNGFLLKGTWADDKGILAVQVTVRNDDTGKTVDSRYAATGLFDLSWSVNLNSPDANGNFPYPDGKYTVDVVATDTSGKTSGTASRSFEIDNTAPVFVIKSPGTFSADNPSKYGSIFKVNGSIAEAHNVKEMLVTVYDAATGAVVDSWKETNVNTAGGTSVTFASYGSSNTTLASNYDKVYTVGSGDQNFYCSIKLTDSASIYDGSSEGSGNSTTSLWINDSIYGSDASVTIDGVAISSDLLSKNAQPQFEIGDFMSIINGTYSGSSENAEKALKILNATKTDTTQKKLSFSLNKDANPTYTFLGYSYDTTAYKNKASKNGAITVKGECGLNETNFKPRDVKVYLVGPFTSTDPDANPITSEIYNAVYADVEAYAEANPTLVQTLYDGTVKYPDATDCSSVSSWTESLTLPDNITSGEYYLLAASGKDIDDVEFIANNNSKFGFVGVSSGTAPSVLIEAADGDSKDTAKTVEAVMAKDYNTLDFLKVYGTVETSDSQINQIIYEVTVKDLTNGSTVGKITPPASQLNKTYDGMKEEFAFNLRDGVWTKDSAYTDDVDARDIDTLDGRLYSYTIVVSATDRGGLVGKANFTTQFDKLAPTVDISSVTPLAEEKEVSSVSKKCVNGIVTVVARIKETNLDSVKVIASTKTGTADEKKVEIDVSEPSSTITAKFDTRELDDNENLVIKIEATDKAGNIGSGTNTAFYIDQSTDIPKIKLSGVTQTLTNSAAIEVGKNLFGMGNNTLFGTISDDDGISNIKIYVDGTDDTKLKKEITSSTLNGSTVYSLTEDLAKAPYAVGAGNHTLYIVVEDTSTKLENGNEVASHCTTGTVNSDVNPYGMAFAFDDDLPEITVTGIIKGSDSSVTADTYSSGIWLPKNFIVQGTASDPSGIEKVVYKEADTVSLGADSWEETLSNQSDTSTGGEKRTYVAYDHYGRSSEVKIVYNIDTKKPVFNKSYIKIEGSSDTKTLAEVISGGSSLWFNATAIKLSGTVSTDTSLSNFGLVEANLDTIQVIVNGDTSNPISVIPTTEHGFSTNLSFQNSGTQTIEFSMTDKAGNSSDTVSFNLNVDAEAPVLVVNTPDIVNDYSEAPLTFTGTVQDMNFDSLKVQYKRKYVEYNSTKKVAETKTAGTEADNYIVTVSITPSGDAATSAAGWTWTMPGDGDYSSIKFIAEDSVGNTAVSDTYTTIVDSQVPVVVSSTSSDWSSNNSPALKLLVGDWGTDGNKYSSGIKEISYTGIGAGGTIDNRGALVAKTGEDKKIYYTYTADFSGLEDGSHSVSVTVTDEAGRSTNAGTIATFNIDTRAPAVTAKFSASDSDIYQKKAGDSTSWYALVYTADDTNGTAEVSGIKSVYVTANGSALSISENSDGSSAGTNISLAAASGTGTSGAKTLYIPSTAIAEGVNNFNVVVEDWAGNKGVKNITVYYDKSAPKVTYTSHAAGATVNKTINISGRIEKNAVISASGYESGIDTAATKVQWSTNGTSWTDLTAGNEYTSVTFESSNTEWTLNGLDTTELNGTATAADRYVRVVITDTYGNTSSESVKLDVDQNADRPVIELSTISAMNDVIPLKKVSGTVSDDDGVSGLKLWIRESDGWDGTSVPTTSNNNGWTSVTVSGSGTWSCEANEDTHSWLFYVIDKNAGKFWTQVGATGNTVLSVPKITLNGVTGDNTSALEFKVDTQAPKITMYVANSDTGLAADSDEWKSAGVVFGGTENKLYIKLEVIEQNMVTDATTGYKLPSLKIGTEDVSAQVGLLSGSAITVDSANNTYTYLLAPITLTKATYESMEGSVTVMATLADQSAQEGQGGTNIILDYTAPSVSIVSPTVTISDAVAAAITVKGTVLDDYSTIKNLEYAIPLAGGTYDESHGEWTAILASSAAWELAFTSGSEESPDSLLYYASAANVAAGKYAVSEIEAGIGIYKVPLYFKVSDGVGNTAINKECYVYVDPNGGKPKAWINAPEQGTVTSGTVTIYGGASDNISVSKVCVQIDVNGDGTITEADYSLIAAAPDTYIEDYSDGMLVASSPASSNNWYILAGGTNSWKCPIITGSLENYAGSETTIGTVTVSPGTGTKHNKYLIARVRAIDGDGMTRSYTDCHCIVIDNTAPWFTDMAVVQYGSGVTPGSTNPIVEREYISGMYISNNSVVANGTWYLTGYVKSNSAISSIAATTLSSTTSVVIDLPEVSTSSNTVHDASGAGTTDGYKLLIPLSTGSSGVIYSELTSANGVGTGNQTVKINIDSTAPSLYTTSGSESTTGTDALRLKSLSKTVGTDLSSNSVIENSDGYFTFGDNVIEAGSGLQFIAFYLQNKTGNKVYDPMHSASGTAISGTKPANALYINSDNLAAFYVTGATRSTPYSLTHSSVDSTHVRVGGLVKIGGSYHTITDVTGTTVTFTPAASTTFTTAELIYAQVVDHQITEYFDTAYDSNDDAYYTLMNDDGDQMCETITQIGTTYQWTASVDSTNIPDGKTYIRVVAMDNAGNLSYGYIESIVANNRPRMTKVFIGTDLNSSGKYDFDADEAPVVSTSSKYRTASGTCYGEFNYYTAYNTRSGVGQSAVTLASSAFKVVNGLCVVPEFVGGNGSLKYNFVVNDSTTTPDSSVSLSAMSTRSELSAAINEIGSVGMFGTVNSTDADGNTNPVAYGGTDIDGTTYYDFGGVIIAQNRLSGANSVKLTFWDETDGLQSSFGSQWATLVIPFANMGSETDAPVPVINPFYWKGSGDNSVYIDSAIAGHIELEGSDLPTDSSYTSGLPKVSGKIKIEGTVTDNVLVKSITMSVFGSSKTVATYSNGTWTQASSLPTGVVSFTATDKELSQNGHTVSYVAVINTELLSVSGYPVGKNQIITISATDWNSNASSAGSTQTASGALTDCYKMDVVPYVTEIVTNLSSYSLDNPSVYARSSVGSYPVYEGETITFNGYNLGSGKASVVMNGKTVTLDSSNQTTVDSSVSSGSVSVSVNGILAVNNINTSDAKGAYSGSASDDGYANCYNRQPNGVNNNMLTDDLALDVWNFKTAASPVGSSANYVHMKVGPYLSSDTANSGRIGFSFKNAIGYFNMPGQKSNSAAQDYYTGKFTFQISSETYKYVHFYNATQSDKNYTAAGSWPGDAAVYNSSTGYYEITYDSIKYNSGDSLIVMLNNGGSTKTGKYTLSGPGLYRWTSYSSSDASKSYSTSYTATHVTVPAGITFSQTRFGTNYGGFNYNTFSFDQKGYAYGAAQCPDTSGQDGMSANFQFFSRAVYDESSDYHGLNYNYFNVTNGRRIENTSYYKGSAVYTDENRVQNPEMATYVSGSTSYVYLAYYDHGLDMIKFRIGSVGSSANTIGLGLQDLDKYTSNNYSDDDSNKICKKNGNLRDSLDSSYVGNNGNAYKYVTNIADSGASPYVAVGALPTNGTAVVVWYDKAAQALKMKTATFSSVTSTTVSWTDRGIISSVGGKYVSMATDEAGGIHLAYLSNSGANLYYTYLSSVSSTPVTMLVDAYQDVGDRCMITVGRESTSKPWIPYISYKSNYASHTKIAYPVFDTSATASTRPTTGIVDGTEKYTGNWNVSLVPDTSLSIDDTISVGVHKDWASGSGVMYNFPTGSTVVASDTGVYALCDATVVYGNGTANPVMGYAVEDGTIQMAQKK